MTAATHGGTPVVVVRIPHASPRYGFDLEGGLP